MGENPPDQPGGERPAGAREKAHAEPDADLLEVDGGGHASLLGCAPVTWIRAARGVPTKEPDIRLRRAAPGRASSSNGRRRLPVDEVPELVVKNILARRGRQLQSETTVVAAKAAG